MKGNDVKEKRKSFVHDLFICKISAGKGKLPPGFGCNSSKAQHIQQSEKSPPLLNPNLNYRNILDPFSPGVRTTKLKQV